MPNLRQSNIMSLYKKTELIFIAALLFAACGSKSFKDESELLDYIKDPSNKFFFTKSINEFQYSLLYRPTDLMVNVDLNNNFSKEEEIIDSLRESYHQYIYLSLSMSKGNRELLSSVPKNRNDFNQMSRQLTFDMRDKVHLYTQDKDTIDMIDFTYLKMYGMSQSTDLLFVYPRDKKHMKKGYLNFTIEDLGFYTGEVKFKIPLKEINNEPRLKL